MSQPDPLETGLSQDVSLPAGALALAPRFDQELSDLRQRMTTAERQLDHGRELGLDLWLELQPLFGDVEDFARRHGNRVGGSDLRALAGLVGRSVILRSRLPTIQL